MKKNVFGTMCMAAVFGLSVGVAAQSGATAQDKVQPGMAKDAQVTVSGCVAAGEAGTFMLNNATMVSGMMHKETMGKDTMAKDKPAKPGMAGETKPGTAGEAKPGMAGEHKGMMAGGHTMSFELVGGDVKGHLGHKVEITGTMAKMDMDRMGKMGTMDKDTMPKEKMDKEKMGKDAAHMDMKAMKLNVKSVKMISATCP